MPNIVTQRHEFGVQHAPGGNTIATVTKAANADGRHVCKSITVGFAGSTAGSPANVRLRDGATGVGTILWSCAMAHLAGDSKSINLSGLNIRGSKNTAMTLEFNAVPGSASSFQTVSFSGYTFEESEIIPRTG